MDYTTPTSGEIALGETWTLKDQVIALTQRVFALEGEVRELRALVTPSDPGSLPPAQWSIK